MGTGFRSAGGMGHLSSMFNGFARSLSLRKAKNAKAYDGSEAAVTMAKEAKKNDMILRSSGIVSVDGSNSFAFSRKLSTKIASLSGRNMDAFSSSLFVCCSQFPSVECCPAWSRPQTFCRSGDRNLNSKGLIQSYRGLPLFLYSAATLMLRREITKHNRREGLIPPCALPHFKLVGHRATLSVLLSKKQKCSESHLNCCSRTSIVIGVSDCDGIWC